MKGKPNIDDFLSGSPAEQPKPAKAAEKPKPVAKPEPEPPARVYKEQKLYRLPTTMTEAVRDKAYFMSKKLGRRVTETEIVETAIDEYLARYQDN